MMMDQLPSDAVQSPSGLLHRQPSPPLTHSFATTVHTHQQLTPPHASNSASGDGGKRKRAPYYPTPIWIQKDADYEGSGQATGPTTIAYTHSGHVLPFEPDTPTAVPVSTNAQQQSTMMDDDSSTDSTLLSHNSHSHLSLHSLSSSINSSELSSSSSSSFASQPTSTTSTPGSSSRTTNPVEMEAPVATATSSTTATTTNVMISPIPDSPMMNGRVLKRICMSTPLVMAKSRSESIKERMAQANQTKAAIQQHQAHGGGSPFSPPDVLYDASPIPLQNSAGNLSQRSQPQPTSHDHSLDSSMEEELNHWSRPQSAKPPHVITNPSLTGPSIYGPRDHFRPRSYSSGAPPSLAQFSRNYVKVRRQHSLPPDSSAPMTPTTNTSNTDSFPDYPNYPPITSPQSASLFPPPSHPHIDTSTADNSPTDSSHHQLPSYQTSPPPNLMLHGRNGHTSLTNSPVSAHRTLVQQSPQQSPNSQNTSSVDGLSISGDQMSNSFYNSPLSNSLNPAPTSRPSSSQAHRRPRIVTPIDRQREKASMMTDTSSSSSSGTMVQPASGVSIVPPPGWTVQKHAKRPSITSTPASDTRSLYFKQNNDNKHKRLKDVAAQLYEDQQPMQQLSQQQQIQQQQMLLQQQQLQQHQLQQQQQLLQQQSSSLSSSTTLLIRSPDLSLMGSPSPTSSVSVSSNSTGGDSQASPSAPLVHAYLTTISSPLPPPSPSTATLLNYDPAHSPSHGSTTTPSAHIPQIRHQLAHISESSTSDGLSSSPLMDSITNTMDQVRLHRLDDPVFDRVFERRNSLTSGGPIEGGPHHPRLRSNSIDFGGSKTTCATNDQTYPSYPNQSSSPLPPRCSSALSGRGSKLAHRRLPSVQTSARGTPLGSKMTSLLGSPSSSSALATPGYECQSFRLSEENAMIWPDPSNSSADFGGHDFRDSDEFDLVNRKRRDPNKMLIDRDDLANKDSEDDTDTEKEHDDDDDPAQPITHHPHNIVLSPPSLHAISPLIPPSPLCSPGTELPSTGLFSQVLKYSQAIAAVSSATGTPVASTPLSQTRRLPSSSSVGSGSAHSPPSVLPIWPMMTPMEEDSNTARAMTIDSIPSQTTQLGP